jgi:hypothetical protein
MGNLKIKSGMPAQSLGGNTFCLRGDKGSCRSRRGSRREYTRSYIGGKPGRDGIPDYGRRVSVGGT